MLVLITTSHYIYYVTTCHHSYSTSSARSIGGVTANLGRRGGVTANWGGVCPLTGDQGVVWGVLAGCARRGVPTNFWSQNSKEISGHAIVVTTFGYPRKLVVTLGGQISGHAWGQISGHAWEKIVVTAGLSEPCPPLVAAPPASAPSPPCCCCSFCFCSPPLPCLAPPPLLFLVLSILLQGLLSHCCAW